MVSNVTSASSAVFVTQQARGGHSEGDQVLPFAELMQEARLRDVDFVSGRIGLELDTRGQPANVVFFDAAGERLASATFNAADILRGARQFGVDLEDLRGLGSQLDAAGIGYRPYELYLGTGSDHGIDFEDLIKGGLGTAYDWRADSNSLLKGSTATVDLEAARAVAMVSNRSLSPEVTTQQGIDPSRFLAQVKGSNESRPYVMMQGQTAVWFANMEEAKNAANQSHGHVLLAPEVQTANASANSVALINQLLESLNR